MGSFCKMPGSYEGHCFWCKQDFYCTSDEAITKVVSMHQRVRLPVRSFLLALEIVESWRNKQLTPICADEQRLAGIEPLFMSLIGGLLNALCMIYCITTTRLKKHRILEHSSRSHIDDRKLSALLKSVNIW